ncbi:hypothetical protein CBM2608_A210071 [Cupriavidus taiwanensis]|nr:hypothetical protein CBM2608_A210071 [Cupriavidus taiwanensis]SPD43892.1 conserved protein of unknown function [Cupriavidus taiwanensis]
MRSERGGGVPRRRRDLDMHDGIRMEASRPLAECRGNAVGQVALIGRRQNEGALCAQPVEFGRQLRERAPFEHHTGRRAVIDKAFHGSLSAGNAAAHCRRH